MGDMADDAERAMEREQGRMEDLEATLLYNCPYAKQSRRSARIWCRWEFQVGSEADGYKCLKCGTFVDLEET